MKHYLFIITLISISVSNFKSSASSKDSIYIKINDLSPKIKSILLSDKGNISIFSISMKNKFENVFRFGCNPYERTISIKNKIKINPNNHISYYKLNKILNEDFLKVAANFEIFFIITEDKNNFYSVKVIPLLPPELNKM